MKEVMRTDSRTLLAGVLFFLIFFTGTALADVTMFCYHRFGEPKYASTNIAVEVFEQQLRFLKEGGYEVLALGELVRLLESGEPLPQKGAVLTVDDGYRSFATGAVPLLEKYGMPATLFVSPASVGKGSYLSWEEIRALEARGIEIGNHSMEHLHMAAPSTGETPELWKQRILQDLDASAMAFLKGFGRAPELFAYPYGEFSPELAALLAQKGFRAAVGQQSGVVGAASELFTLPRFPMGGPYGTLKGLRNKVRMLSMPVSGVTPASAVLGEQNPPPLQLRVEDPDVDLSRIQCFVQGKNSCEIIREKGSNILRVVAEKPLPTRRNKYTLTAPSKSGKGWYWFSQPWIRVDRPE